MSFSCPSCNLNFGNNWGTGTCPSCDQPLTEKEEEMANVIKCTGDTKRFYGQRSGVLRHVENRPLKSLSKEQLEYLGIPEPKSNRFVLVCIFMGDKGIPFIEIRPSGSTLVTKTEEKIGQTFEIDWPVTDVKPQELELK